MRKGWILVIITALCLACMLPKGYAQNSQAIIESRITRNDIVEFLDPVIIGLDNLEAENKINAVLSDSAECFGRSVRENPNIQEAKSKYEVQLNKDGILSLTIIHYTFSGGAHGMSYMEGYTFDLASGYRYKFSDLVAPERRKIFDGEVRKQIKERNIYLLRGFEGLKDEPDFYLQPDGKLVVFYQLYELAPYSWGFVRFPLQEI